MSITMADSRIDAGSNDIMPEQEREIEAREECERRGIDPDEFCADGGVTAGMVVDQERFSRPQPKPLFWYRPVGIDGGYEGPLHTASREFASIPEHKRDEWKPLFTASQP